MAGGHVKYRHLSRSSSHRQALLRNLVTSLFQHESIQTTWHKAKEAQRLAEKVVTLAKRNTPAARIRTQQILYTPESMTSKIFGEIRERYLTRPGGYTRVLRIEPIKEDQAPSAILQLVDGPKDMRFAMTARTLAHVRNEGKEVNDLTAMNIRKVTRFRQNGENELEELADKFEDVLKWEEENGVQEIQKKKVYPDAIDSTIGKKGPKLLRSRQG